MARTTPPRTSSPKSTAKDPSAARGEEITRTISGNTIVDSTLRSGSPDVSRSSSAGSGAASNNDGISAEELRRRRIEQAAYYRAEQRGFAPGYEVEDWLAAEREVGQQSGEGVVG